MDGVGTSVVGRSRRLSADRRSRPTYTFIWEEPRKLRKTVRGIDVEQADALLYPFEAAVIVGNIPFHITTPLLRRLLNQKSWATAVLTTQWEVARKRAGVGGSTMMSAQAAPWYEFSLEKPVPARAFTPMPSVDGGVLRIERRASALVPFRQRTGYEAFVKKVFTGRGGQLATAVAAAANVSAERAKRALSDAGIRARAHPRDVAPQQWATLWNRARLR